MGTKITTKPFFFRPPIRKLSTNFAFGHEQGVTATEHGAGLRWLWLAPAGDGPVAAAEQLPRPGRLRLRLRPRGGTWNSFSGDESV